MTRTTKRNITLFRTLRTSHTNIVHKVYEHDVLDVDLLR